MTSKEHKISGETFVFTSEHALFWPKRNTLVISDLHLGKAETFQQNGLWLPAEAQHTDLKTIKNLLNEFDAAELYILGDLIHTAKGMTAQLIDGFANWSQTLNAKITVTTGNHDQSFFEKRWPHSWNHITPVDSIVVDHFLFQHEPDLSEIKNEYDLSNTLPAADARAKINFAWYGHLHPKIRLDDGVLKTRVSCFYLKATQGFLPAFSSLAGGETIHLGRGETAVAVDRNEGWLGLVHQ